MKLIVMRFYCADCYSVNSFAVICFFSYHNKAFREQIFQLRPDGRRAYGNNLTASLISILGVSYRFMYLIFNDLAVSFTASGCFLFFCLYESV